MQRRARSNRSNQEPRESQHCQARFSPATEGEQRRFSRAAKPKKLRSKLVKGGKFSTERGTSTRDSFLWVSLGLFGIINVQRSSQASPKVFELRSSYSVFSSPLMKKGRMRERKTSSRGQAQATDQRVPFRFRPLAKERTQSPVSSYRIHDIDMSQEKETRERFRGRRESEEEG